MVMHTCNPSTQENKARGSQVWSQPGLHSKTLSQKTKQELKRDILRWQRREAA
jgi:hypothetical protein